MATLSGFNANTVEPSTEYSAIPAGKYLAVITNSEMKPTRNNTGRYLELTFEVIEGDHKGRKVWARLNLENVNVLAVQIARGELSAICRAVGIMTPNDSAELHNLPLLITVKQKKRDDTGDLSNEIKGYARKEAAAGAGKPAQAATATPPWRR